MDASRPAPNRTLAVLSLGALAFSLGQTTLVPALTHLRDDLGTDTAGVTWTMTGYLLAAAVATPVFGRLGDMFGKQRMLVLSLALFALGSAVSAVGGSIELVVAGRLLQGVGGGIFPLSFGIIRDEFPRDRVAVSIGFISAILGIGGGLGLVAGGVIVDAATAEWIFGVGAIMGTVAAVATWRLVPESPVRRPGRVDVPGAIVLAAGIVLPLYAITNANDWGWGSTRTVGLIGLGIAVLAAWVRLELRTPEPLADVRLLARPAVLMTNVTTVFVGFGMFGSFILVPQILEAPTATGYGFGLTATAAGLAMVPGALVMIVVGPVSGSLARSRGPKVPLVLGAIVTAVGLGLLAVGHGSVATVVAFNLVTSVGIALAYAAMPNLIVEAAPIEQTGEATGMNNVMRSIGSSVGAQLTASILGASVAVGDELPGDAGYTAALGLCAALAVVAAVSAVLIPTGGRPRRVVLADAGAAEAA